MTASPNSDFWCLDALRGTLSTNRTDGGTLTDQEPAGLPGPKPGEPFLRGPIPLWWLDKAGRLPGRVLHVAILLWQEAGCRKCRKVRVNLSAGKMGLSRN